MLKANKTGLLLFFCATIAFGSSCRNNKDKNLSFVTIQTFHTQIGWGYDISINKKIYIHQPFIPVVAGEHGFPSEKTAFNAAKIVVEKMKKKEIPSLTRDDLKRAGVPL